MQNTRPGRTATALGLAQDSGPILPETSARDPGTLPDTCLPRSLLPAHYDGPVSGQRVPGGVVHKLPGDLRKALIANATALDAWKDITPLARNEFICWVEDAKQETTRERRIRRTQEELEEGQRRPCCWPGCRHRERTGM
jgi:Bacteriocin-protection, YdeI or OmpD-Associated